MVVKGSDYSNPSTIKLLEEAAESHVSPYNNAYTYRACVFYFFAVNTIDVHTYTHFITI